MQILDVGAGLGANTRYYATLLDCDQEWTLVEKDVLLAESCLPELCRWAESNGWGCCLVPEGLEIRQPQKRILVHILPASVVNLKGPINLPSFDLAMANAVLDLLSKGQLFTLMAQLSSHHLPIYATLNYKSMLFEPRNEEDLRYIRLYEQHMRRRQDFGRAMGRDCSKKMITCLEDAGYEVGSGNSTWIITSPDRKMLCSMLSFMEASISEMLGTSTELARLDTWVSKKLSQADKGQLRLQVEHMDIFGRFPQGG